MRLNTPTRRRVTHFISMLGLLMSIGTVEFTTNARAEHPLLQEEISGERNEGARGEANRAEVQRILDGLTPLEEMEKQAMDSRRPLTHMNESPALTYSHPRSYSHPRQAAAFIHNYGDKAPLDLLRDNSLEKVVHDDNFFDLPNRTILAAVYDVSCTKYMVLGHLADGSYDRVEITGKRVLLDYNGQLRSVLPKSGVTTYTIVSASYIPSPPTAVEPQLNPLSTIDDSTIDGSDSKYFTHKKQASESLKPVYMEFIGSQWRKRSSQAKSGFSRVEHQKVPVVTLRYAQSTEAPVLQVFPISEKGGVATWSMSPDDLNGIAADASQFLANAGRIVHEGDPISKSVLDTLLGNNGRAYARKTDSSLNHSREQIDLALRLGDEHLSPDNFTLFNAFPQRTGLASWPELVSMDLNMSDSSHWQDANVALIKASRRLGVSIEVARKADLLKELATGDRNVLVVIAHGTGDRIYLPGINNESISIKDLRSIRRKVVPPRSVILISCYAGEVNGTESSLAEALLNAGLARTVFASEDRVPVEDVPTLLKDLLEPGAKIAEVLQKFKLEQIVETNTREHFGGDSATAVSESFGSEISQSNYPVFSGLCPKS
jgi:hypothetical protein